MAYVQALNGNINKAAKKFGMPTVTLWKWVKGKGLSAGVSIKEKELKKSLADLWEDEVRASLEEAAFAREAARYPELILGAATATDKMRLMQEKSTSISETRSDSVEEKRRQLIDLLAGGMVEREYADS